MKPDDNFADVQDQLVDFLDKARELSSEERQEVQELAQSITDKEIAEGNKEQHKKRRVLYQRVPEEALPFVIYCLYIGVWGGFTLIRLPNYSGQKLWILSGMVVLVMVLPLFVLHTNSVKSIVARLKSMFLPQE